MLCFMSGLGIQWYACTGKTWRTVGEPSCISVYVIYCSRCVNAVDADAFFFGLFLMDVEHGFRVSTTRAC